MSASHILGLVFIEPTRNSVTHIKESKRLGYVWLLKHKSHQG